MSPAGSPVAGSTAALPIPGTATVRRTVGTVPAVVAGATEVITPVTVRWVELVRKMVLAAAVPDPDAQKADIE